MDRASPALHKLFTLMTPNGTLFCSAFFCFLTDPTEVVFLKPLNPTRQQLYWPLLIFTQSFRIVMTLTDIDWFLLITAYNNKTPLNPSISRSAARLSLCTKQLLSVSGFCFDRRCAQTSDWKNGGKNSRCIVGFLILTEWSSRSRSCSCRKSDEVQQQVLNNQEEKKILCFSLKLCLLVFVSRILLFFRNMYRNER